MQGARIDAAGGVGMEWGGVGVRHAKCNEWIGCGRWWVWDLWGLDQNAVAKDWGKPSARVEASGNCARVESKQGRCDEKKGGKGSCSIYMRTPPIEPTVHLPLNCIPAPWSASLAIFFCLPLPPLAPRCSTSILLSSSPLLLPRPCCLAAASRLLLLGAAVPPHHPRPALGPLAGGGCDQRHHGGGGGGPRPRHQVCLQVCE